MPEGRCTVTTTTSWAVDWTTDGAARTIPLTQTPSVSVRGELQVLVR